MPELPEVETVVRGLRETVLGKTIQRVRLNAPPATIVVGRSLGSRSFSAVLKGRQITSIERRGKNILLSLSGDITLWVHLKMTGHFFYLDKSQPIDKHDLVVFDFQRSHDCPDSRNLRFNDYRRFGRMRLFANDELWEQKGLEELGPEPLKIAAPDFVRQCKATKRMIKPALLDQTFIAGLGNIYADESLYASRIHPRRMTCSLSSAKLTELHGHIQRLLKIAIRNMGTSVDSFSGVNGQPGEFQKYLRVYGREGLSCERCGGTIVREKVGSRSAHYCRRCQRI